MFSNINMCLQKQLEYVLDSGIKTLQLLDAFVTKTKNGIWLLD